MKKLADQLTGSGASPALIKAIEDLEAAHGKFMLLLIKTDGSDGCAFVNGDGLTDDDHRDLVAMVEHYLRDRRARTSKKPVPGKPA